MLAGTDPAGRPRHGEAAHGRHEPPVYDDQWIRRGVDRATLTWEGSSLVRLDQLLFTGLLDSFGMTLGWTVFSLLALQAHGLAGVGAYSAAMLVGVALSAPATAWLSPRLGAGALLRCTSAVEAVLRILSFVLLLAGAPVPVLAGVIVAMYASGLACYAGMRAEVSAASPAGRTAATMTLFVTAILAIEAVGVASAALLPGDPPGTAGGLLVVVVAVYGLSPLPVWLVARGALGRRLGAGVHRRSAAGAVGGRPAGTLAATGKHHLARLGQRHAARLGPRPEVPRRADPRPGPRGPLHRRLRRQHGRLRRLQAGPGAADRKPGGQRGGARARQRRRRRRPSRAGRHALDRRLQWPRQRGAADGHGRGRDRPLVDPVGAVAAAAARPRPRRRSWPARPAGTGARAGVQHGRHAERHARGHGRHNGSFARSPPSPRSEVDSYEQPRQTPSPGRRLALAAPWQAPAGRQVGAQRAAARRRRRSDVPGRAGARPGKVGLGAAGADLRGDHRGHADERAAEGDGHDRGAPAARAQPDHQEHRHRAEPGPGLLAARGGGRHAGPPGQASPVRGAAR